MSAAEPYWVAKLSMALCACCKQPKVGTPLCYGLVDFSETTRFAATTDEIKSLAHINVNTSRIIGKASAAIIAPTDCVFGIARMWEAYANATAWNTCVFRDANEAKA